jgi:hypothetical protein
MTVALRSPNNPNWDYAIMQAARQVCVGYPNPNTSLGQSGYERVFIRSEVQMFDSGLSPAILLHAGRQQTKRSSQRTYNGMLDIYLDYYQRWNQASKTFDQIRADAASDLELMKSNLETNDSLTIGPNPNAESMPQAELDDDRGRFVVYNSQNQFAQQIGGPVVLDSANLMLYMYRRLTCHFNLLDYDART